MVSASKLKKDFVKYEKDELEKLSDKECDKYIGSLVSELMKNFKNGAILGNPDADEIADLIDSYMEVAKKRFNNADIVLLDRKFRYLFNAYLTANITSINNAMSSKTILLSSLVSALIHYKLDLRQLLLLYYDNYSNQNLLNELFFNLSTADNLDVTFEIHEKYLNNEFGVNNKLIKDLNIFIKLKVESIFELIEKIESIVVIDEIAADGYFDDVASVIKETLKNSFNKADEFEKTALINSGYDNALFFQLENAESEIGIISIYLDVKEWFMNLYNGNGFAEISAENFELRKKINSNNSVDFDEYMKSEPKYDLKNFKLIESDVEKIAY